MDLQIIEEKRRDAREDRALVSVSVVKARLSLVSTKEKKGTSVRPEVRNATTED